MATNRSIDGGHESFLLELLYLAGWHLRVRRGNATTIRAMRDEVSLKVT